MTDSHADATARRHAELLELVRVVDRVEDHLLQVALHVLQTANVVPPGGARSAGAFVVPACR